MLTPSSPVGNLPGLNLVAWALINGTTGALIKGAGVTTSRVSAGIYRLTFTTARSDTNYLITGYTDDLAGPSPHQIYASAKATASCDFAHSADAATNTDYAVIYAAVWA